MFLHGYCISISVCTKVVRSTYGYVHVEYIYPGGIQVPVLYLRPVHCTYVKIYYRYILFYFYKIGLHVQYLCCTH